MSSTGSPVIIPKYTQPVLDKTGLLTKPWFRFLTLLANVATSSMGAFTLVTGTVVQYAGTTVPTGFLLCNGAAVSRTAYGNLNALAAAVSYASPWGAGDGSSTFNIPSIATVSGIESMIKT
jgi:hypothetical protein